MRNDYYSRDFAFLGDIAFFIFCALLLWVIIRLAVYGAVRSVLKDFQYETLNKKNDSLSAKKKTEPEGESTSANGLPGWLLAAIAGLILLLLYMADA